MATKTDKPPATRRISRRELKSEPALRMDYRKLFENARRAEARLSAQFAVTKVLAETNSLEEAAPQILKAFCQSTGWQVGALWSFDSGGDRLRCVEVWRTGVESSEDFVASCRALRFECGIDVPGKVWKSRKPTWIPDILKEEDISRAPFAFAAGLHAAFAFPIIWRKQLFGVVEFFSRTIQEPDGELLSMAAALGSQIGQFVERKRAEEALRASEQRNRTLLASIPERVFFKDRNSVFISVNKQFANDLGMTPEELIGKSDFDFFPAELAEKYCEDDRLIMESRQPASIEERNVVQGVERIVAVTKAPVVGPDGEVMGVLGLFRDITERKRAELALQVSEQRFQAFNDNTPAITFIKDQDGRYVYVNRRFHETFDAPNLIGRTEYDWVPEDIARELHEQDANVLESGQPAEFVAVIPTADGISRRWMVFKFPVPDPSGQTHLGGVAIDITARAQAEQLLEFQALHDALTGLPNRSLLQDRLAHAINACSRSGGSIALLLMDLDRFKEINDTFGHHCGDLLLQQLKPRMEGALRPGDTIARLGGDEFAIILPGAGAKAAQDIANRMIALLQAPFELEGYIVNVGASIGISLYPEHGTEVHALLRRADIAMYLAKQAGNSHSVYDAGQDAYTANRLTLIAELREAVKNGQLSLHYQPKIGLQSGEIVGVEALLRWEHPRLGFVPPEEFIPLAEHTGEIRPIGYWVMETALKQLHDWEDEGFDITMAVNLSSRNLNDPELVPRIEKMLKQWKVLPGKFMIELTESAVMSDPERAVKTLESLRKLGVEISIDDFGTGYSSLAYLRKMPVGQVKIDQSFVKDMVGNAGDAAIVRSVIDLGHNLALEVVAEGVESREGLDLLSDIGCDSAQGYYISRPIPAAELTSWLKSRSEERSRRAA